MNTIFNQLMSEAKSKAESKSKLFLFDSLSDLDYCYNQTTGNFDLPAIEWDGIYGKHWEVFKTEEERSARLKKNQNEVDQEIARINALTQKYYNELLSAYMSTRPTLGNLCPQLAKLKTDII